MDPALVLAEGRPAWADALPDAAVLSPGADADALGEAARAAGAAFVDGALPDPLAAVRRLRAVDADLQPAVVAAEDVRPAIERALLFSPGMGELWIVPPDEVDAALVARATAVTEQRRRYRGTRRTVARDLARAEPRRDTRALISDAFLATLLDVLPDPVVSLDDGGRVLSWNPAAERVLGWPRGEAVGREVGALLRAEPAEAFQALLRDGCDAPLRGEFTLRRRSGERAVVEVAVAPARAAGHDVRAVVLHDVTHARETQAELEAQAAELESQAAELEILNADLAERTVALEQAQATRSRFYAAMSHELRTPINAVLGYNQLVLDGIYGGIEPTVVQPLTRVQTAAKHLLELVNDVLDLSKIEAGRIDLEPETTDVSRVLGELMDTVRPVAQEQETELVMTSGGPCEPVVTDPRRLRQIVLNLLSNAIKFGEGRPVRVGCRAAPDGGVEISVADEGRGIAPEDQERIFEEFVQVDAEEQQGTGLGLPISRRLAQILGGSLDLDSEPGRGSTFTLRLPPRLPPVPPPPRLPR
ncbi:PAS domain-containing sensor histidine kinase [Longimicrobium sp.]|uniref:PAS domain-containing sensor histidine kinase n=1 Tax=Longimicrobium sp. TaxID=2029185 RepID=UPI002E35AB1F|nr:ATP-binding protein [Longimicrobium sp.]HEX6040942.1 ATP-binding protein [Longimicrobium sp.]